jgi:peptidoglycan/LPS O-acetylase OafA/YrhL
MKFRNDIQILRALAVIFVVLYHLEVPGFANGLLGVDIFFAISGHLMYRIYNFDQGASGFYMRRARRLLPGYFAVILCTVAACFVMAQPSDFAQVAVQAAYGSAFASNIGFWAQNSYFSSVDFKPLLHLWSLAAEMQFYLFVPLIMWLDRRFKYILYALVAVSLLLCLAFLMLSPNLSFFMMPMRLWQFGLGMLAAKASMRSASMQSNGNPVIGIAALAALFAMLFYPEIGYGQNIMQGHPGLGAIIATAATALCLRHGLPDSILDNFVARALRYVGDISYSIYLVHFPVIVLVNYRPFDGTILGASGVAGYGVIAALITGLAWLCYQIFEKRAGTIISLRNTAAISGLLLLVAAATPVVQARMFDGYTNVISGAFTDRAGYRCGAVFKVMHYGDKFCVIGAPKKKRGNIMLIGDSHTDAIKTSFADEANRADLSVIFPVSNDVLAASGMDEKWLLNAAQKYGVRHVFFHFSIEKTQADKIEKARILLWQNGIRVTVIMPIPIHKQIVPQKILYAYRRGIAPKLLPPRKYESDIAHFAAKLRAPHDGYSVIEPKTVLCLPECLVQGSGGRPLYFDKHHLTLTGARVLSPLFRAAFDDGVIAKVSTTGQRG